MHHFLLKHLLCLTGVLLLGRLAAQPLPAPVADWHFWPNYTLGGKAANFPGPKLDPPASPFRKVGAVSVPLMFHQQEPTERKTDLLAADQLPKGAFSIEMWLVNHVNRPVGMVMTAKDPLLREEPTWLVGWYGREALFSMTSRQFPQGQALTETAERLWSGYWVHLVATYDGDRMQLYLNGQSSGSLPIGPRADPAHAPSLEIAGYLAHEPYMQLANLLKQARIYGQSLTAEQVNNRFKELQQQVAKGILFPDLFHFTAGPYLNYPTPNSINIVWETDRPAQTVVRYGTQLPLDRQKAVPQAQLGEQPNDAPADFVQKITLDGLQPATNYFYDVLCVGSNGDTISSGVLTFATPPAAPAAFSFAVIGDTEARPHINDRIAKLIWDERPNFCLNVGDLTDGGQRLAKYQWTYEYFQGMTQLHSRIPVVPVAGNGESDLYWYKKYHALPEPVGYYQFSYGNADFFMLNSNRSKEEFAPGGLQYEWLKKALANSRATWKFVAHHHAPYSADEDDYGNSWQGASDLGDLRVRQIVPLYEQFGVDMVFFGHLHTYQRTMPIQAGQVRQQNGVIYVQGGGGGGNLEDFAPNRAWFSAKTYRGHHYFTIQIFENTLSFKMYDAEGKMRDFLECTK